jgi:excinuclease ABC subunit B
MLAAAEALEFERAAAIRDRILALKEPIGSRSRIAAVSSPTRRRRSRRGGKTGSKIPRPKKP